MRRSYTNGPMRISTDKLGRILQGLPLFLLLAWCAKVFSPDLRTKSGLMARDLELRLEIVSSGAALWKQLLLPMFTAVCLLYVIRSRHLLRSYIGVLTPVMLLGTFLIVSFFWSDSAEDTMRRAVRQVFLFAAVAGAVVIGRFQNRFITYIQAFSIFLLVFEALFLFAPWISFDPYGNFTGLHPAKNEFGGIAGAFLLISICILRYYAETPAEKKTAIFSVLGWGLMLLVSGSKTPMGFVAFLVPFLLISHHFLRQISIGVIVVWLMIIVFIPMALIGIGEAPIDFYRSILPEEALTGRTGIWYHLLADLKKNWMFGTAYGAYWGVGDVPEALDIKWSYYQLLHTAHSGFVDLCMELGVIPTVFWLCLFWVFLVVTRNSSDPVSSTMIAYGMLHNCLETSFLHGLHFVWVIMIVAIMNILYTHAQKPNLDSVFRKIRKLENTSSTQSGTGVAGV